MLLNISITAILPDTRAVHKDIGQLCTDLAILPALGMKSRCDSCALADMQRDSESADPMSGNTETSKKASCGTDGESAKKLKSFSYSRFALPKLILTGCFSRS